MAFAHSAFRRGAALNGPDIAKDPESVPRKRRHTFYLVGSAVAAAGITLGTMPMFREMTPILVAKGIALVGALILAVGRFAPDSFLRRFLPDRR